MIKSVNEKECIYIEMFIMVVFMYILQTSSSINLTIKSLDNGLDLRIVEKCFVEWKQKPVKTSKK